MKSNTKEKGCIFLIYLSVHIATILTVSIIHLPYDIYVCNIYSQDSILTFKTQHIDGKNVGK